MLRTATAPLVVTAIPTHNTTEALTATLSALATTDYPSHEVVIVDDASADRSSEEIVKTFHQVSLIRNTINIGFAASINRAVAEAIQRDAKYAFLLNSDVAVANSTLERLVEIMESDDSIAAVMPKVLFYDRPNIIQSTGVSLYRNIGLSRHIGAYQVDNGQFTQVEERDALHGCAMLVRCAAWRLIGSFWEPYFAYFEEVDWCVAARDSGYRLCVVPSAQVWHRDGLTFDHASPRFYYLFFRNRLFFIRRHRSEWDWRRDLTALCRVYLVEMGHALKHRKFRNAAAMWRGICDFARGKTGPPR